MMIRPAGLGNAALILSSSFMSSSSCTRDPRPVSAAITCLHLSNLLIGLDRIMARRAKVKEIEAGERV
jgi:hypothetical protein